MFLLYLLCSLQTSAHCRSLPQSSDGNPNFRSQNFELHKKLVAEKISAPPAILPTRFRNGSYTLLLFPNRSRSFPLFSAEWTISVDELGVAAEWRTVCIGIMEDEYQRSSDWLRNCAAREHIMRITIGNRAGKRGSK